MLSVIYRQHRVTAARILNEFLGERYWQQFPDPNYRVIPRYLSRAVRRERLRRYYPRWKVVNECTICGQSLGRWPDHEICEWCHNTCVNSLRRKLDRRFKEYWHWKVKQEQEYKAYNRGRKLLKQLKQLLSQPQEASPLPVLASGRVGISLT